MNEQPQFPPAAPPPQPSPQQTAGAESTARVIYILYLISLAVGVTALVGVVMAYVNRGGAPSGLDTHYRYIIRTFWIGLLYTVIGGILTSILVGFGVLLFTLVWLVVRCAKGLRYLGNQQPIPDPGTWLW